MNPSLYKFIPPFLQKILYLPPQVTLNFWKDQPPISQGDTYESCLANILNSHWLKARVAFRGLHNPSFLVKNMMMMMMMMMMWVKLCAVWFCGRMNLVVFLGRIRYLIWINGLFIYFISDLHNGWTKYKTKWSEAGTVCFQIWI